MKYSLRTITWKFQQLGEPVPELEGKASVTVNSPQTLVECFGSLFKDRVRERFVVFWLSSANKILGLEIVSEGTLSSSLVHPREVFRGAIVATAASIIVAHNHPSENPEPSQEDLAITKQIVEAGKIVGVPVYDHIIFAGDSFTSFAERGLI
jgi:DNA repair protein RadC